MGRIRQSATWGLARRAAADPAEAARTVAELGFVGIEMAPEEHWAAIRAAGLAIPIVSGHRSLRDGVDQSASHPLSSNIWSDIVQWQEVPAIAP